MFTYMGYGAEIVADSIIAIAMTRLLSKFQSDLESFDNSRSILQKFLTYSINTGLLTTIFIGLSIVCYIFLPHSFAYLAFYFVFGKLYLNSLLGTLNARSRLRSPCPGPHTSALFTTEIVIHFTETSRSGGDRAHPA